MAKLYSKFNREEARGSDFMSAGWKDILKGMDARLHEQANKLNTTPEAVAKQVVASIERIRRAIHIPPQPNLARMLEPSYTV